MSTRSHFLGDDDQTNRGFYWYQFLSRIGVLWLVGKSEKRGGRMSGDGDEMRRSRSSRTAATTTGAMLVVAILLPQPQPDTPPSTSRCTTVFRRLRVSYGFAAYNLATSLLQCLLSIPFQFVGRGKTPAGKTLNRTSGYLNSGYTFLYLPKIAPLSSISLQGLWVGETEVQ